MSDFYNVIIFQTVDGKAFSPNPKQKCNTQLIAEEISPQNSLFQDPEVGLFSYSNFESQSKTALILTKRSTNHISQKCG